MRASSCTELIRLTEDAPVSGIMLGHNYCAEQEWGVDNLRVRCGGMTTGAADAKLIFTMDRIAIKIEPSVLLWYEEKGLVIMGVDRWGLEHRSYDEKTMKKYKLKVGDSLIKAWAATSYEFGIPTKLTAKDKTSKYPPLQTRSAWDGEAFGIATRDPETIEFLRKLRDAMLSGDAVMHVSGTNNPFKPTQGLLIGIRSMVPQEMQDQFRDNYADIHNLREAVKATGIEEQLRTAKKGYFALSPRWARDEQHKSRVPIVFWLNPMEQKQNNFGWYTIEDLEAWIKNEGPIPMKKEQVRA